MNGNRTDQQTYYELLEISTAAGPTEIYDAYQRAKATYSPNSPALYSMFSAEEAKQLLALIEEAYQTLSHQARRKAYDSKLGIASSGHAAELRRVDEQWVGPVKVVAQIRKSSSVPSGHAKTKFGIYEINPNLEQEIAEVQFCDGPFLQRIRDYKQVSPDQMCEELRITRTTLNALESNQLDSLPVAVFTRGFVINYARTLALDEKKISEAYMKFFKANKSAN